jgi:uncharacterized membrane protein
MRTRVLLWSAIAAYAAGFSALSVLRHRAFTTGRFDLGNMTQTVWNTAHGDFLELTSLQGEQISRLAAHTDVILLAFVPLWWLWPSPELLLVTQSVLVALGALPVFWLARKHLASERSGLGFALAYLLYPATQWLTLNEFHPVALATPLLLFAFWYLDEDRLVPFALFGVLAATTKEEIALVVAGFGLWYAVARRRRTGGGVIAACGVAVSLLAVLVVIPHFNENGSAFRSRYDNVPAEAFEGDTLRYLFHLGFPLLGLFALAPLALVATLPEFVLNVFSTTETQTSIHFHYTAGLIAPLVIAAVLGAKRVRRAPIAVLLVAACVIGGWKLGAVPLWGYVPGGEDFERGAATRSDHDRVAERALRLIPRGAVVSATNSLGAHLSERRRVLNLPKLSDSTWVAIDETRSSYGDRLAPIPSAAAVVRLRRNPRWKLVFQEDGIVVFQRRTPNNATSSTLRASSDQTSSPPAQSSG